MQIVSKPHVVEERIEITREFVDVTEKDILLRRHIERYMDVRWRAHGVVLDCACGVGYGSYFMSKLPDVTHVHAIDADEESILLARENFQTDKVTFHVDTVENFTQKADCLVSIETIEHLDDPTSLARLCDRCEVNEIIVSFPIRTSTHYNRFHKWDLTLQDIQDIFPSFVMFDNWMFGVDTAIVRLVRHTRESVASPRRWNKT